MSPLAPAHLPENDPGLAMFRAIARIQDPAIRVCLTPAQAGLAFHGTVLPQRRCQQTQLGSPPPMAAGCGVQFDDKENANRRGPERG
ncbi:MAG: hypothetical protein AAGH42_13635, partial [Pseudomonadota bacterium]